VPNVLSGRRLEPVPIDEWGIADERRIYFQTTGLIRRFESFRPPTAPQAAVARAMVEAGQRVAARDQVGFFGYAAGPALHIVDTLALCDPLLARLPARPDWRIGHYGRELPDGYIETLRSGENRIRDPALASYYAKLALVTRGPLFSWERVQAVAAMNLGREMR
jgi:arabinofuranosyltransferase